HIARLDRARSGFEIVTTLAHGRIQGLSSLTEQIREIPSDQGKPVAAINGDFFLIKPGPYQGDPEGLQIWNGDLVSAPHDTSFWVEHHRLHIEKVSSQFKIGFPSGKSLPFGLNQTPTPKLPVFFTSDFGPSTCATNCLELLLERLDGRAWVPLKASQKYGAR